MAVTTINIDSQVLTFANLAAFPVTGTVKTIYIAEDTNFQYYWDGSQYVLLTTDINIPANLIFYATTAPSSVSGYERLVISPDDVDYDNPAVDVPTGAITTTAQLVGEQVADANIFAGNPGILNISTIGEIRRTSGTGTAEFYFEVYQRDSVGTETLRGTSNKTAPVSGGVYQQFQVDCLFNNGTWLSTDRVVIKFYADRVAGGSNPNYDFLFGGANPVRTLFPISAQLLLNVPIAIGITGVTGGVTNQVLITDGSGKLGQSELKTVNSNSLLGSGDVSVGTVTSIATAGLLSGGTITSSGTITTSINTNRLVGRSTAGVGVMEEITIGSGLTLSGGTLTAAGGGITIGTTAIASGTVNRILFEGAGNVVQQDSAFVWNNTDKRLILGTEAVADTNSRLVVIGKGTGTNTTFAVHNSTGTNNALVVRDDGFVGIGINEPNSSVKGTTFRVRGGTNDYLQFTTDGGVYLGLNNTITNNSNLHHQVVIGERNTVSTSNTDNRYNVTIGSLNTAGGGAVVIGKGINVSTSSQGKIGIGLNISTGTNTRTIAIGSELEMSSNNGIAFGTYIINTNASNNNNHIYGNFFDVSGTNALNRAIVMGQGVSDASRAQPRINDSFSIYFQDLQRSFFVNKNSNIVLRSLGALTAGTQFDTNATNTLTLHNGTAPTTNIADAFQQYSADIVAGNAAPHFRTENGDIVKIYRVGGWGLPTGSFTRTTFDTTTVTLQQLAERVAALIQDLRDNHQLLKA